MATRGIDRKGTQNVLEVENRFKIKTRIQQKIMLKVIRNRLE